MNVEEILSMTSADIEAKKSSLTKQKLIEAIILLKDKSNECHANEPINVSGTDNLIEIITGRIQLALKPIVDKLNEHIAKYDRMSKLYDKLKSEQDNIRDGLEQHAEAICSEAEDRSSRRRNLIFHGVQEPSSGSPSERAMSDSTQVSVIAQHLGYQISCLHPQED